MFYCVMNLPMILNRFFLVFLFDPSWLTWLTWCNCSGHVDPLYFWDDFVSIYFYAAHFFLQSRWAGQYSFWWDQPIFLVVFLLIWMREILFGKSCLCALTIQRAMLAGAYALGRATHARQVKGEKPDKYSERRSHWQQGDGWRYWQVIWFHNWL